MSNTKGRTSALRWAGRLNGFMLERQAEIALPDPESLPPLEKQQMAICAEGFGLFLDYAESQHAAESLKGIVRTVSEDRLLVVLTDRPGGLAVSELLKRRDAYAIWLTEHSWVRWQRNQDNRDPDFRYHYRYWTYWNQRIKPEWNVSANAGHTLWVHTEGHLFQQMMGGWAQHLWTFDGSTLTLVQEAIESGWY